MRYKSFVFGKCPECGAHTSFYVGLDAPEETIQDLKNSGDWNNKEFSCFHCSSMYVDLPKDELNIEDAVEALKAELENRNYHCWLDRADTFVEKLTDAGMEENGILTAVKAFTDMLETRN